MNNQNYNYGNYSQMPPNQPTFNQQPIYSQQQQQYFNPQFANNPMVASWSYPQAQQFPVPDYSNPVGVYNVPPPPPQENQPSTFTPNQNQNQNKNNKQKQIPNNQSNRGRNKQNWTRGRGGGGRGGGSFGSGTQREIQQNQGNFKPTNNRNNRNQNQGRNNFAQKNLNSTTESPTKPANVCQPVAPSETATSQEEIDFDEQFKKWEEEFDKWKHANVNHPDKNAYRQYEQQFEAVRQKLLKRRQEMQKKKMDEKASAIKTAEQLKFESQWQAGPSQDKNKNPLKPLGESTIVTSSASSTQIPINQFKLVNPIPNSSNDYSQDDFIDESFEDSHSNAMSTKNFGNLGKGNIPGLDLVSLVPARSSTTNNQEVRDSEMICDDDEQEEEHYEPPKVSPPLPVFKSTPNRFVININEFLETPGRSKRPEKFVVFIRGAPGSGKSYLANLIQEKEVKMGNNFCTVLSINKYIISRFESSKIDTFQEELIREFRKKINENVFKFIIVEIEGGKLTIFNRFMQILMRDGNFKSFVIELNQPFDVCKRYNINRRSLADISSIINDINMNPSPDKLPLIDPTSLLRLNSKQNESKSTSINSNISDTGNITNLASNLAQLLQNKNVMDLLHSQLNPLSVPLHTDSAKSQNQEIPPFKNQSANMNFQQGNFDNFNSSHNQQTQNMIGKENFNFNSNLPAPHSQQQQQHQQQEQNYDNVPTFVPSKIIDYKHCHMPTFEETLMEFKIFQVIDYKHRATPKLKMYVSDIDTVKIIEKRKAIAQRKKILEYLRNAERPEDTVSNPKYPRNWEIIKKDRPPLKNKRKKKLTAKIKRIIAESKYSNSWMKEGYVEAPQGTRFELEEISSDDSNSNNFFSDSDVEEVPLDLPVQAPVKILTKNQTIPDFNPFNHQNIVDIKTLLWNPGRFSRPYRILIVLRGAPGSGKSHLTQLIKRKEKEMGNNDLRIISINDFKYNDDPEDDDFDNDPQMSATYLDQMLKLLKRTIKEGQFRFIIVDAENVDNDVYNNFLWEGKVGKFTTYTIELHQTLDICLLQNRNKRSESDIKMAIEKLNSNRIQNDKKLLIATALYDEYKCMINPDVTKCDEDKVEVINIDDDESMSEETKKDFIDIREILEEPGRSKRSKNVMIILRGPSGVGKTYLADLIRKKEISHGNVAGVVVLSIDDHFINPFSKKYFYSRKDLEKNVIAMLKSLREIIQKRSHNFIIIDSENETLREYQQFYGVGTSNGFKCYAVELRDDPNVCYNRNIHNRSLQDVENVLMEMDLHPIVGKNLLLDTKYLYSNNNQVEQQPTVPFNNYDESEVKRLKMISETLHEKFLARFRQPLMVNGVFIERNVEAPSKLPEFNWHNRECVDIRQILEEPGRLQRPDKIMIVLRGAPGSGKSYLARLIERKEEEKQNIENFKILSMSEFYEKEETRQYEKENGMKVIEKYLSYQFELEKLEVYKENLLRKLVKIVDENLCKFIVIDVDCCDLNLYNRMIDIGKANGFTGYAVELNQDDDICHQFNDHRRDEKEVLSEISIMKSNPTPDDQILLDPEYLYHEYQYNLNDDFSNLLDVGDDDDDMENDDEQILFGPLKKTTMKSKWDDDDKPDITMERLDGTRKKSLQSMAEYLQTDDEWTMRPSTAGKKRVRWADIEEKKAQERMRDIGFIVGQTDWNRMTDTSDGKSALEKTKYIESRKK